MAESLGIHIPAMETAQMALQIEVSQHKHKSPNKTLDRTAMSAGLGVFADSRLAAALMAVGQLGR